MKKYYNSPSVTVVMMDTTEIIVTSPISTTDKSANGSKMYGRDRHPIWEED